MKTREFFPSSRDDLKRAAKGGESPQEKSASYRLAFADQDFLLLDELRPVRLQLELLKPEIIQQEEGIISTVVVFGGTRIPDADTLVGVDCCNVTERLRFYDTPRGSGAGSPSPSLLAGGEAGRKTVKVLPSPTTLSMLRRPRWRFRICLTIARPRPVPPKRRERPLSAR